MAVVVASYFTDPACIRSWAAEPALRRLVVEFGENLRIAYVMAGLAREFGPAEGILAHWLDVAAESGMPVDPRLWLDQAPRSSYPACMGVRAAAEQGDPGPYLRRLREGIVCRRRALDRADGLLDVARETGGLDLERFRIDLGSHAIVEAFGADLERARAMGVDEPGMFPTIVFSGPGGEHAVHGPQDYEAWREAAEAAGAQAAPGPPPGVAAALARFGTMATPEVAAVCALPGPRAAAELWRLAEAWEARAERILTGELWSAVA